METHFLTWHYSCNTTNILVYNVWFGIRSTLFVIGLIYIPCLGPASLSTTSFLYPNISALAQRHWVKFPCWSWHQTSYRYRILARFAVSSMILLLSDRRWFHQSRRRLCDYWTNIIIHKMARLPLILKKEAKRFHVIENSQFTKRTGIPIWRERT